MKYKICRSILLTLMSLIIIISTMGLVSGAELQIVEDSLSSNLLVPQNLYSFLESVFIQIGKAEHEFQNVDISGFFENPVSNSSYQFFNRRIQYYQSFRTKYFDPVVNLNQSIEVIDYCQKENGLLSLTVKHRVSFSYAHMPSDSRQTLTYFIELIPNANSYLIRNMESNDFADSVYRNDIVSMERETASYNALPVNKAVLVDESQTDQTGLLSDVSLRGTVSGNNILMNRSNAVNYSYIYANDPRYATSSEFNPLFGYLSADCMNFVSQCI